MRIVAISPKTPRLCDDEPPPAPLAPPPIFVDFEWKPVLYLANGKALVRKAGF